MLTFFIDDHLVADPEAEASLRSRASGDSRLTAAVDGWDSGFMQVG